MRLVITLPSRQPTPADNDAIEIAVSSLRLGMGLRTTPPWSIESDAEKVTTREAAERCKLTMDGFTKAARSLGIEPAAKIGGVNLWAEADVERVRGVGAARRKGKSTTPKSPEPAD